MTAESRNQISTLETAAVQNQLLTEPAKVVRTPAEKARILARLTIQLATVIDEQEARHGNA